MRFLSSRFGEIEVADRDVLRFKKGILGFEGLSTYALLPYREDSPFCFLHSTEDRDLCFVVTAPHWFRPDYRVEISRDDMRDLDVKSCDELAVYTIVTVPQNPREMTANLLAPLLVNKEKGYAKQTVQRESAYRTRHVIIDEIERAKRLAAETGPSEADSKVQLVMVG